MLEFSGRLGFILCVLVFFVFYVSGEGFGRFRIDFSCFFCSSFALIVVGRF